MDAMGPAGEEAQAAARLCLLLRLRQDAAADRDDGVGRQQEGISGADARERGLAFLAREAAGELRRQLALARRLVDVRRRDLVRPDPDLVQEREPPRRGRGEDQARPRLTGLQLGPPSRG